MVESPSTEQLKPVRVGLLVDSPLQRRWICRIIERIQSSDYARIVLVIQNSEPLRKRNLFGSLRINWKHLLYLLYSRLDHRLFDSSQDAFLTAEIWPLLRGVPVLRVNPRRTQYSDYLPDHEIEQILDHRLDVAMRFGFRILRGRALQIARHGVWSYHHGDNLVNRGGPACFWEVMENSPVTGSILQILSEDLDNGKVIYRSYSRTQGFSVCKNRDHHYWKSSAFVIRKLKALHREGPQALEADRTSVEFSPYSSRLYRKPDNRTMLPLLTRLACRYARHKLSRLGRLSQWMPAYRISSEPQSVEHAFFRFRKIVPPLDRVWADPFPVAVEDRYCIFIEECEYRLGKGHISVLEMDRQGNWKRPVKILERPYHLSYPFVFRWDGCYYMIPETAANGTVEIYRCRSFPWEWELEEVLLTNVRAVDATLFQLNERWWMFTNIAEKGALNNDELHLFYADCPLGPWRPHRLNPVKSDVRSARPAGGLFYWKDRLYRPSQDCSLAYGGAVVINRIRRLDEHDFDELEVSRIHPHWDRALTATHTFNQAGGLTVIDGRWIRSNLKPASLSSILAFWSRPPGRCQPAVGFATGGETVYADGMSLLEGSGSGRDL